MIQSGGGYYIIDIQQHKSDITTIFQNFHFPLIDYTKLSMRDTYKEWDCEDIFNATWFCHTPINGKPCGICSPCRCTIKEGLSERFTKTALLRYHLLPVRHRLGKIKRRLFS